MKRWITMVTLSPLLACGVPLHPNNAAGAIIAAAAAVAEVAVYRATQNGCWGQCGAGAECDNKTGLCERIPCGGQCKGDLVCQQIGSREECVPADLAIPTGPQPGCVPVPDAGSLLVVVCSDAGSVR